MRRAWQACYADELAQAELVVGCDADHYYHLVSAMNMGTTTFGYNKLHEQLCCSCKELRFT